MLNIPNILGKDAQNLGNFIIESRLVHNGNWKYSVAFESSKSDDKILVFH